MSHDRFGIEKPRHTKQVELRFAIQKVLDHYLQDELADWKQSDNDAKDGHIYNAFRTLRTWIEEQRAKDKK